MFASAPHATPAWNIAAARLTIRSAASIWMCACAIGNWIDWFWPIARSNTRRSFAYCVAVRMNHFVEPIASASIAQGAITDPALAELIKVRDAAPNVQLYFDTAFGTSVGGAMNDEIALMFAGESSPEDIVEATQQAADQEK